MTYALRVKFKSNEAPWSGNYEPASWMQPADDDAAIKWAVGMSDGLGTDYLVTLTKDGAVISLPEPPALHDGHLLESMSRLGTV